MVIFRDLSINKASVLSLQHFLCTCMQTVLPLRLSTACPLPDGGPLINASPLPDGGPMTNACPLPDRGLLTNACPLPDGGPLANACPLPDGGPLTAACPFPDGGPLAACCCPLNPQRPESSNYSTDHYQFNKS